MTCCAAVFAEIASALNPEVLYTNNDVVTVLTVSTTFSNFFGFFDFLGSLGSLGSFDALDNFEAFGAFDFFAFFTSGDFDDAGPFGVLLGLSRPFGCLRTFTTDSVLNSSFAAPLE